MDKKVAVVIGVFLLLAICIFVYRPAIKVYSIPPARKGFILGARTDNAFLFMFYEHPDEGLTPLSEYDVLYSNELYIYALSYTNATEETLILHMYRLEERKVGNTTVEVKVDVQNKTVTILLRKFQISKNVIELPIHDKQYVCEFYTQNKRLIFKFYHETHPLFLPAKKYTLGSLFMDRLAYVLSALIVCLVALSFARYTVDKRRVVPRLSLGVGLWIMTLVAIVIYITARVLIYVFGLLNVAWTYIPIFAGCYFFGFSLLKPRTKLIYLMRTVDAPYPAKELHVFETVEKNGKIYDANISWLDFLRGNETEIRFEGKTLWHWKIENTDDVMYIFREIQENGNIVVKLEDIHEIDVDKWMSQLKTTESIAKEKEYFRVKLLDEIVKKETEIDRRVLKFVKNYEKILLMEGEESE